MRRLKRLASLTSGERRLLLRALFVVGVARAALCVLPVTSVRRVAARTAPMRSRSSASSCRPTWAWRSPGNWACTAWKS